MAAAIAPDRAGERAHAVGHGRGLLGRTASALAYLTLTISALLFLLPFYLLLRNGLDTDQDITGPTWTFFPTHLHWENFSELFGDQNVPFLHSMLVSCTIAVLQTAGILLLCSLAGYGLARIPHPHANKVFYLILASLMIPSAVTFVPSFVLVSSLGWVSSLRGLVVPGLFSAFTVFLFRQYFLGFPRELEEAARVDGLGYWSAFWRIVVPNSKPIFAALAVISFFSSWNAFLWPLVIGQDSNTWTVQVALSTFLTAQTINIHELFLAALIAIVPLLFVFAFLQRFLVQGVASSGIKG